MWEKAESEEQVSDLQDGGKRVEKARRPEERPVGGVSSFILTFLICQNRARSRTRHLHLQSTGSSRQAGAN